MKLLIKETSIKGDKDTRTFNILTEELTKCIDGLAFDIALQSGNIAVCESNEFNESNFLMQPDKFKKYVNETLNFRYENFTILFI